jgi:hypothetical protein
MGTVRQQSFDLNGYDVVGPTGSKRGSIIELKKEVNACTLSMMIVSIFIKDT